MKRILIALLVVFLATVVHARDKEYVYYIIDTATNRAIGVTNYLPDELDLASRGEIAILSDSEIPIGDAEYVNGKIKERMKSQEEKNKKLEADEEEAEMTLVYHRMFTFFYQQLRDEGVVFKHMHKHIDPSDL